MAAPLNTCTTIEQRGVVRFLWAKNMDAAKDMHKERLPIWAAFLCGYPFDTHGLVNEVKLMHTRQSSIQNNKYQVSQKYSCFS
jgi:hypothetical protein